MPRETALALRSGLPSGPWRDLAYGRDMTELAPVKLTFSDDQAEAYDRVSAELFGMGVDLDNGGLEPAPEGKSSVLAVVGKAGSGKTMLLASLYKALAGGGGRSGLGRLRAEKAQGAPHPGDPCRRPTRRPRCCGCAACLRPRSTAFSTPRSMIRNMKRSPNG